MAVSSKSSTLSSISTKMPQLLVSSLPKVSYLWYFTTIRLSEDHENWWEFWQEIWWLLLTKIINLLLTCAGVVLAAEKKEVSSLFVPTRESGKLYKMDDHILVSVSGVVADANMLIDNARVHAQRHIYSQGTPIYCE